MTIRKPYDGIRKRVALSFIDEETGEPQVSLTEQHHKTECDIRTIIKRYDKTGLINHVNSAKAEYGDFTMVNEYQDALNTVINAQNAFDELPSDVRKKFNNDPGAFFEYATNPDNLDGMVELGLAVKPDPVAPQEVIIVESPAV